MKSKWEAKHVWEGEERCQTRGEKWIKGIVWVPRAATFHPAGCHLILPPTNSSLIGWSRMPASNFCPQTDNEAATLFIMDYCTAHDVPPLHWQLTKELIEYLSGVHLWAHVWTQAIEHTEMCFTGTRRCTHRCIQTFTQRNLPFGIYSAYLI